MVPCVGNDTGRTSAHKERVAVGVGFEPTEGGPSLAFEASPFGRFGTPPKVQSECNYARLPSKKERRRAAHSSDRTSGVISTLWLRRGSCGML
jgi:hypothetical protein